MRKRKLSFKGIPYIVKNKGFSTIDFEFIFHHKYDKKYLFYLNMIRQFILTTSFDYKTEKEYKDMYSKLMIINFKMNHYIYNENLFIKFNVTLADPKVVSDYDFEAAFKFFVDAIFRPNAIDGEFDNDCFEREKEFLKNDILSSNKNIYTETYQRFLNIVDDNGILKDNIYNNMYLVDNSNPKEMYDVYKELVLDNRPVIIVYGDVDESINTLIKKYYPYKNDNIEFIKDYHHYLVPFKNTKEVIEDSKYNQSVLYVAYKVKNMTNKDGFYLSVVNNILGKGVESLIFKKLRLEEGLVYSASNWCSNVSGILVIEAYINNESKDRVIEVLNDSLRVLKDENFLMERINRIIDNIYYSSIREKDNKYKKMSDFVAKKTEISYTSAELLSKYKKIDIAYLIDFIDRLTLDTIYFSRGKFNEE